MIHRRHLNSRHRLAIVTIDITIIIITFVTLPRLSRDAADVHAAQNNTGTAGLGVKNVQFRAKWLFVWSTFQMEVGCRYAK